MYRQELGSMCFWRDVSDSRCGCCCLVRFLSSSMGYCRLVCGGLSVDLGETLVSDGGRRFVFWCILLSDLLESDGVLKVPSGWRRRCDGRLCGRCRRLR